MKSIKVLFALTMAVCMFSCDDSDGIEVGSFALTSDPTFTVTESSENPGLFFFENTTPGKEDFYSFWEISDEGGKLADNGILEYEFETSGSKNVTLTMVGSTASRKSSNSFDVTLPIIIIDEPTTDDGLILNGGLEQGDGSDFTNWVKNNGPDRFSEETVEVYSGSRSAKIVNDVDGNPWETQFITDGFATVNGTEYTVSVWAKGDPAVIRFSTNPGVGGDQYGPDYTVTSEWAQYSFTFTANSDITLIALDMGATSGTFYIDEIMIVEGSAGIPVDEEEVVEEVVDENDGDDSSENIILNGGLEEGTEADFTNWLKNNGPERFSEETEDVYAGSRAVRITNEVDGNPWETQFISDAFTTENGADYTVSVWVKGDPAVIRFSTNPGVGGDQYGADYTVTADWSQYSFTFTANSDTTLIALDMGATTGTFVIDDIVAVKN